MAGANAERKWAWEELGGVDVADTRRRDRVVSMATRLAKKAAGTVSGVFDDAAERQGAYDLLEGGRVSAEALVAACARACVERSEGQDTVFVAVDETSIQVVDREKKTDLGLVGTYTND